MQSSELMIGVARVLRTAAAADAVPSDYQRSQLLCAASVARHLAAEGPVAGPLLADLRFGLKEILAGSSPALLAAREEIAAAAGTAEIGVALVRLLPVLDGEPEGPARRARLRRLLAELTDREVAALAAAEA